VCGEVCGKEWRVVVSLFVVDDQRKAQYSPAVIAEIFEEEGL